jgi:O-acetyl-ADP-ribose deacetylase (regulator of RNase III)
MITYVQGDLFTSPAEVLVNTVNTVGVMGKGIAKEFKRVFPEMFDLYQEQCESGSLRIGTLFLYQSQHKAILNFPTKQHWRSPSKVEYIERGLQTFVESYEKFGMESIAFPQLGCGNGELDWESEVRPVMERHLTNLPIRVFIHIYDGNHLLPEHHDKAWMRDWLRSEPENLPAMEVWEDLVRVAERLIEVEGWSVLVNDEPVIIQSAQDHNAESDTRVIRFQHSTLTFALTEDALLPLWRKLRVVGYLSPWDLPPAARKLKVPVLGLLAHLDYLVPASFSAEQPNGPAADINLVTGLKLLPRASMTQRTLIEV